MPSKRLQTGTSMVVVKATPGSTVPDTPATTLLDGVGNLLAATDNGDGTASLNVVPQQGNTFRTNAGGPAAGQSNKTFTGNPSIATGATVVLETVATGKTLYITDISVGANTAVQFLVQIQAGGVTIWQDYCKGDTGPIQLPGIETQPSASGGQQVQVVFSAAAATTAAFFIGGIEQ